MTRCEDLDISQEQFERVLASFNHQKINREKTLQKEKIMLYSTIRKYIKEDRK